MLYIFSNTLSIRLSLLLLSVSAVGLINYGGRNLFDTTNGIQRAQIKDNDSKNESYSDIANDQAKISLVIVSCGSNHVNAITLIKSAIIFSSRVIHFHIITENSNENKFVKQFATWPEAARLKFTYQFTEPFFPNDGINWQPLFRKCASERLFLADMFNSTDAMLYVDADALFLDDVSQLWDELKKFSEQQLLAVASDSYKKNEYSNNQRSSVPFYGKKGINSGVMLMNLARIREFKMYEKLVQVYQKYKNDILYGDQCLLNALFSQYPDRVYDLDCSWNFFFIYCSEDNTCPSAKANGMKLLHGAGGTLNFDWPRPEFRLTHQAFKKYDFNDTNSICVEIQQEFENTQGSLCSNQSDAFLKPLTKLATFISTVTLKV